MSEVDPEEPSMELVRAFVTTSEEILASVIGSLVIGDEQDAEDLMAKAVAECLKHGVEAAHVERLTFELRYCLEKLL